MGTHRHRGTSDRATQVARRARQLAVALAVTAAVSAIVILMSAVLSPRPAEELLWGSVAPTCVVLLIAALGVWAWWFSRRNNS